MKTSEIISIVQILAGTLIILLSIAMSIKAKMFAPKKISGRGIAVVSVTALFLAAYIVSFFMLMVDVRFPFELITGSLFLGSACSVYMAFKLTRKANSCLEQKIDRYRQAYDRPRVVSLTDELTGLYNREGFFALMDNHIKLARRQKKRMLLFYVDIENLKGINDSLGHQEGDLMLIEAANILRASFRKSDIIARVGDDEFAVFLVGATEDYVEEINEKFHRSLEIHNAKRHPKYRLSVKAGVAHYDPEYNDSIDNMLAQASELIYSGKYQ